VKLLAVLLIVISQCQSVSRQFGISPWSVWSRFGSRDHTWTVSVPKCL